jgi:hypothetical protein
VNIRDRYLFLRFLQGIDTTGDPAAASNIADMIVEAKREIRRLRDWSTPEPAFMLEHRIVRQYDDGSYVELILIDPDFGSAADIERFIRDNYWIEMRPSMYDCTGQLFSNWYSIFRTPRGWRIYHSIGIDW